MSLVARSAAVLRGSRGLSLFVVALLVAACSFVGLRSTLPATASDLLALTVVVAGVGFAGFVTVTPLLVESYTGTVDAGETTDGNGRAAGAPESSE